MNKKILGVIVFALTVAMLATPVLAKPTKGQKAAMTIEWTPVGPIYQSPWKDTGNVKHRNVTFAWEVTLIIDGGPTLTGTATSERKFLRVLREGEWGEDREEFRILNDYYVLTFTGGTFEGNGLLQTDFSSEGASSRFTRLCHILLKGTGDFKGQTINGSHDWRAQDLPIEWTGYILKPPPPPP